MTFKSNLIVSRISRSAAASICLLTALTLPALAGKVWSGSGSFAPLVGTSRASAETACGTATGDPARVTTYFDALNAQKKTINERFVGSLIQHTKAYQAVPSSDIQGLKAVVAAQYKKMKFTLTCQNAPFKVSLTAKNGDGLSAPIDPHW
jgi:hypothetical protein